ncbi:hypothetical protein FOPG_09806 [Fusarium oxysporum f. sp. conglutinans race 2 54008]|uniref:Uncharacterized protein n=2 Tax=Fusarium oxysporum f. sp. conglutinans TaxID=100902 RepID=A0A8H6GB14_FUSOX|nr:hypothetical protein FOPG_09806 [Fusarium oxysporum f. sp. conglutinans race 2 54008]KAF6514718.1 hypothetical protein HZS61_005852 [Fusarium oxysporum f. sp. conglutinans]KAG7004142.1 hypothetical protein FocnCong_v001606 [Fusarium oxysporum f. sp. conglutinans]KAI8400286.1 hypothetical protein FOFC_19118 [Fusarium oxysporum]
MTRNLYVPFEIVLQILETSIPPGEPNRVIDVATPEVQQLVTWTRVCRATYEPATRFLRQHCVHLDSIPRLQKFLRCLNYSKTLKTGGHESLPKTIPLFAVSSIYLGLSLEEIQSIRASALVRDVFLELGGSVRRLIIDLPFRRIAMQHSIDAHIDQVFSRGLQALINLEEFVTLGGLPSLEFWRSELNVSQIWPKLRKVAGFSINLSDEGLWYNVARHRNIAHLVITRPYLLRVQKWNIKQSIGSELWNPEFGGDSTYARPLKIVIVNHEFSSPIIDTEDGNIHDPAGLLDVSSIEIPMHAKRVDYVCREWLIKAAKEDTLWGY